MIEHSAAWAYHAPLGAKIVPSSVDGISVSLF
jgi:hypothetical protein